MSDSERLDSPEAIVEDNSIEMKELKARVNALVQRSERHHIFEIDQRNFETIQCNFDVIVGEIQERLFGTKQWYFIKKIRL